MAKVDLTVHVSTKLNRSHAVTGRRAIILPTLGRTDRDKRGGAEQRVTVEDSMGAVHASRGRLTPPADDLLSEVAIVARLCAQLFSGDVSSAAASHSPSSGGDLGLSEPGGIEGSAVPTAPASKRHPANVPRADWYAFESDYALIRAHIERVIPGFDNFETRIEKGRTFFLPNGPRDNRHFATPDGKAQFTVNPLEYPVIPPGRLLLQTLRSHDQYNTTIYGKDDRYRGIYNGRRVVMVNAKDIHELGFAENDLVDLASEWANPDGSIEERRAEEFRIVAYNTPKGNAAAYYPETNVLVPLDSVADVSGTPTSKAITVRLEKRG